MSKSARSVFLFGLYLAVLGIVLRSTKFPLDVRSSHYC
jgi:hypothetical protein